MSEHIKTNCRYNLRNRKNIEDEKKVSNSDSDSDETYIISSDEESDNDSFIVSDDENEEKMDMLEYRKFLSKLFPSKHINEKIDSEEAMINKLSHNTKQDENDKDEIISNKTNNDEKKNMNFKILFTIENNKNNKMLKSILDEDYDSDYDEDEDMYSETDEESETESDEEHDENEYDEEEHDEDENMEDENVKNENDGEDKIKKIKKEENKKLKKDVNTLIDFLLNDLEYKHKNYDTIKQTIKSHIHNYSIYDTYKEFESCKKKRKIEEEDISKSKNDIVKTNKDNILSNFNIEKQKAIKNILSELNDDYKDDNEYNYKCNLFIKKFNKYLEKYIKKYDLTVKRKQFENTKILKEKFNDGGNTNDLKYFKKLSIEEQEILIQKMNDIEQYNTTEKPYRITLIESDIPVQYKAHAIRKINALNNIEPGGNEYYKIKKWVDGFMKIPFGKYNKMPISMNDGIDKCSDFMLNAKNVLDNAVYGMNDAKKQILQMMGQIISNPSSVGSAIAINGPMGTGKTTLVKEGVSKILNRPFAFIPLGGATDSSYLEGHSYTYEGSVWGQIVDIIINCGCMNPVIYFDELDKISDTAKGEEIVGILTHLTDTTQNTQFQDKYFSGINFDLSKVLFIFSYNDEDKVNKILLDRMYRIKTEGYNKKDKIKIARNYLIPSIERNINFKKGDINIQDDAINYINENLTQKEKGVRNLKRCIEILYTKLNLFRLMKKDLSLFKDENLGIDVSFPFTVTQDIAKKMIKDTMKNDGPPGHLYC